MSSHANWENYLRRIVDSNWVELEHHPSPFRVPLISQDGVELTKNLTFNELPLSDKIDLFYALCDYRLWCEDAAEAIKDYTLEELRLESIGKDSQGYEYWYFSGTRIFRENRELSQDIILRKKRIKELEYNLIELEKTRIFREQEEKRKAELERARQLANEAREARLAAKKQQEETSKRKKQSTPILPPRTGLRERRSSATSNNNDSQQARTPTTRSKIARQQQQQQPQEPAQTPSLPKTTRSSTKNSTHNSRRQEKSVSPDIPKKSPEEECRDELKRLAITPEDRAEAWCIQCESLEEWESFATKFEKTKSINEKYLSAHVNEHLLPKIRNIYAKRAAEIRRKEKELLFSLSSRRVSTRIISKRAQEEEEERQAQLHEAEMRRKKIEAEHRLRAELEREMRARQNRFVVNGGTSSTCSEDGEELNGRYNLRQPANSSSDDFEGIIHPDNLSEFYEALELVVDTVRTSKHAWPFVDPVPETVPGYYDLITEPMDLRKLRTKIEFREYKSLIELEKDFQILVNNCERFNGPRNVYTKMVYKLWKSFRKNVRLYLQRDLTMDEYETFVYPPQPQPPPPPQPQVEEQPPIEELTPNHLQNNLEVKQESEQRQQQRVQDQDQDMELDNPAQETDDAHDHKPDHIQNVVQTQNHVRTEIQFKVETQIQLEPQKQAQLNFSPKVEPPEPKAPTPEIITEEIIIDSYDVPCPDDNFFLWPQ